ncbi:hypothetical protein SAMN06295905_3582 [Devosia lucknowensis]|uniref:Uncharacterized protein n=1 Tax=Devosia lucknowensis TaxID=1096929 RepID=A0A1Y6GC15_9HYPH|nr:hypothetical protein [Devosia lucknowensis]SMQ86278.1 hypothetical protein SAMN06295905_3582 [Devosia lucknowensis]
MAHQELLSRAMTRHMVTTHWLGQSGRDYALRSEPLDTFAMTEADLYVIAKGRQVLWVGSTADLVADPISRSRFRLALDCANGVFRLDAPEDRLATIWDLEQAVPAPVVVAQAA